MRYHHNVYAGAHTPRYLVLFDLQWKVIECQRLEPGADLPKAMAAATRRLTHEGWHPESEATFGFAFLNLNGARRLLILTERDPHDGSSQAFSPCK